MRAAKTIAVTGANRGIGAAIAVELAARGYRVGCLTRGGALPPTEALNDEAASRLIAYPCDVTDESAAAAALAELAAAPGGLAGLVNNAGILLHGRSESFATADFQQVMTVNATAVFGLCKAAFPHLVANGGGDIVNIGSFFDRLGARQHTAYAASKAAVGAITRSLAVEWASRGIRLYNVAPGYVATDMNRDALGEPRFRQWLEGRIPLRRPGRPEEVARLVAALFTEDLPFLTGETIYLDGGQSINQ